MARRVKVAVGYSTGRVKALRVVLLVLQHFCAALLVRALFPLLGWSAVRVPFPSLIVAAAEATEDPERPAAAAAEYSSSRAFVNKDRLAGNAAVSTDRAAPGGEGTAVLDRREATRAKATTDDATAATEQDAGYKERAMRTAGNHVIGEGAIETGETKERAGGASGWIGQGVAAPGDGTLNETAAQGGPPDSDGEAAEPWTNRAAGLTQGRTPALEPADVEAAAPPTSTDLSFADARSSSPALSGTTYATSPTRKPAAGLKRTMVGAFDRTARLSPLAAAAFERAAAASAPAATRATALGDRSPSGGPPIRFASLKRGGAAALERAAAAAAAARAESGSSLAPSPKMSSEDARGSSKKVSAGVSAPADAAGASSTEVDAPGGSVPSTPAAATPSRSASATSRPPSPACHSAPAPALTVENISSFAAALLTGTVRRLAFERCDRYTQKVAITASPGDTVVAECQGAARTIPTDIQSFCCRGTCGRCTTKSAVSYNTLYRTGLIPHFRYAAGDGISSPWRLKIPESLQPPYPTFSVAWLGPAALDIPVEATAGATGVPTATLVVHIEAPRQPDDRLALLRSPGAAAECLLDEPPKKEEDDMFTDEERREESGRLYERTLFGLRRVSQAPAAAAPRCALHVTVKNNGSCVRNLLPLLELLRCVPWSVVLSAVVTGSMAFWA